MSFATYNKQTKRERRINQTKSNFVANRRQSSSRRERSRTTSDVKDTSTITQYTVAELREIHENVSKDLKEAQRVVDELHTTYTRKRIYYKSELKKLKKEQKKQYTSVESAVNSESVTQLSINEKQKMEQKLFQADIDDAVEGTYKEALNKRHRQIKVSVEVTIERSQGSTSPPK